MIYYLKTTVIFKYKTWTIPQSFNPSMIHQRVYLYVCSVRDHTLHMLYEKLHAATVVWGDRCKYACTVHIYCMCIYIYMCRFLIYLYIYNIYIYLQDPTRSIPTYCDLMWSVLISLSSSFFTFRVLEVHVHAKYNSETSGGSEFGFMDIPCVHAWTWGPSPSLCSLYLPQTLGSAAANSWHSQAPFQQKVSYESWIILMSLDCLLLLFVSFCILWNSSCTNKTSALIECWTCWGSLK